MAMARIRIVTCSLLVALSLLLSPVGARTGPPGPVPYRVTHAPLPAHPAGAGLITLPALTDGPGLRIGPTPSSPGAAGLLSLPGPQAYPIYRWPLARMLDDGLVLVNYVDHDPGPGVLDYEGGVHTYDTHAGTDYALYNFRLMDRGCPVYAAASGTVAYVSTVAPGAFDRNCGAFPSPDDGSWIWIDHGDGTYHDYYHLRAWSLTVRAGDAVQTGQMLGLVGSSGYSTFPHLHFETGDFFGGPYAPRDPYTGPDNSLPSLWPAQEAYQGDRPLRFLDMGVFSEDAVPGGIYYTSYCDIIEGIQGPAVFGLHEPQIDLWLQFQGDPGDSFRVEVRRPDHSVWAAYDDALAGDARFDWFWVYWFWDGNVGPADTGTWTLRAYANGALSREMPFEVGPATAYGPRLVRAGRSFRVGGAAQSDTLRLTPLSTPVTFALVGAPPEVSLADSIVIVGATSSQPYRSAFFQVTATDDDARADTAWYHLVDLTKPFEPTTAVPEPPPPVAQFRLAAAPNPAPGRVTLSFALPQAGPATLTVFDVAGRRVRTLAQGALPAGVRRLTWDGRDDAGREVASGVYLGRLAAGGKSAMVRIVLAR